MFKSTSSTFNKVIRVLVISLVLAIIVTLLNLFGDYVNGNLSNSRKYTDIFLYWVPIFILPVWFDGSFYNTKTLHYNSKSIQ